MEKKFERLNVNMPVSLMDEVRLIQEELGLNKTSVVIIALKQYLDAQKALRITDTIKDIESLKTLIEQTNSK